MFLEIGDEISHVGREVHSACITEYVDAQLHVQRLLVRGVAWAEAGWMRQGASRVTGRKRGRLFMVWMIFLHCTEGQGELLRSDDFDFCEGWK